MRLEVGIAQPERRGDVFSLLLFGECRHCLRDRSAGLENVSRQAVEPLGYQRSFAGRQRIISAVAQRFAQCDSAPGRAEGVGRCASSPVIIPAIAFCPLECLLDRGAGGDRLEFGQRFANELDQGAVRRRIGPRGVGDLEDRDADFGGEARGRLGDAAQA